MKSWELGEEPDVGGSDTPRTGSGVWLSNKGVVGLYPQLGRLGNEPEGGVGTRAGF